MSKENDLAFSEFRKALVTAPILIYLGFKTPFMVTLSSNGRVYRWGTILTCEQVGLEKVVFSGETKGQILFYP